MQVGIDSFAAAFNDASRAVSRSEGLRDLVEQMMRAIELVGDRVAPLLRKELAERELVK